MRRSLMDKDKLKLFGQKIFSDMAGSMAAGLCYLGNTTGLFTLMAHQGPLILEQIISNSKLQPRYVEEWVKGMVSCGYIEYNPTESTYEFPDEHAYLLASKGTDHYAGGLFHIVPPLLSVAPQIAEAFIKGGGVPFDDYHHEIIEAIDLINRGNYDRRLVSYWLKSIPGLIGKLNTGSNVLDVGCGVGRVLIKLAEEFPNSEFLGIDLHEDSIARAKTSADEHQVSSRVKFIQQNIFDLQEDLGFDLVTLCDCLHDVTHPEEMLQEIQKRLNDDGALFIIEPKVADNLEDNCNNIATMLYGFSIFHCMTQSLAEGGPGLGTCMGPKKAESLVRNAGFSHFEILDIKSQVNLFYLARK